MSCDSPTTLLASRNILLAKQSQPRNELALKWVSVCDYGTGLTEIRPNSVCAEFKASGLQLNYVQSALQSWQNKPGFICNMQKLAISKLNQHTIFLCIKARLLKLLTHEVCKQTDLNVETT